MPDVVIASTAAGTTLYVSLMRGGRAGSAAVAAVCVAVLASIGHAQREDRAEPQDIRASLAVEDQAQAGAACVPEESLRAAVQARFGREVFTEPAPEHLHLHVRVKDSGAGASAVLEVYAPGGDDTRTLEGQRELHAQSCQELSSAMGLVIALTLLPAGTDSARDDANVSAPSPAQRAEPVAPPRDPRVWLALHGGASTGMTPRIAPLLSLSAHWTPPRLWPMQLTLAYLAPTTAERQGVRADVRVMRAELLACPVRPTGLLALCGGVLGALVGASGRGELAVSREPLELSLALVVRALQEIEIAHRLRLWLQLGAGVALVRPSFGFRGTFGDEVEVFRAEPVLLEGAAGIAFGLF